MIHRVITKMTASQAEQAISHWQQLNEGSEPHELFAYEGKAVVHTPNERDQSWLAAYQSVLAKVGETKAGTITERMVMEEWAAERWEEFEIVEASNLPDREFRDAWEPKKKTGVAVSMPSARKLHAAKIRTERNSRFAPLDEEYQKHDAQARYENNAAAIAEAKKVEAKRQALRDAPATVAADIERAKTPEQLKAIWPDALKEEA